MADIVLGCDSNGKNDSGCQNEVAKVLEKNGHKVEKLTIGPNYFASYSYDKKAKGKIGIYMIAAGITSIADLYVGNTQFKYGYIAIRGDLQLPRMKTMDDFKKNPIGKDKHGDCSGSIANMCNKLRGKTFPQMNEVVKDKLTITFGSTPKEIGENLVKAMGGEVDTDSSSDDSKSDSGGSSIKEALQKLLKHWDGEVECYIRGDEVHINKIRDPETYYVGVVQEGLNVFSDSISVTDVNSDVPNVMEVQWTDGVITFKDEKSIKRFGEIQTTIVAVRKETVIEDKDTDKDKNNDTTSDTSDSGTGEDGVDLDDNGGATSSTQSTIKETPINNYEEALKFARLEWNKLQRDNGRTLECQVLGSNVWKSGEWVRVYLPSYWIDGYMYITRVSQSLDGGDWTASLSLVDYPPGWGKEEVKSDSSDSGDDSSSGTGSNVDDIVNKVVKEISKFSYSHSCSDGKCIKSSKKGDCWALSDYIASRLKEQGVSAKIYQYATSGSSRHRQVKYNDGGKWVMFPYSKSGIDHNFYTNSIPANAKPL